MSLSQRSLRGIEFGVLGGLASLLTLFTAAFLRGQNWWQPANLLGSTFYGARARLGLATLAGFALHIVITGSLGLAFGLATARVPPGRRLLIMGALSGLSWYYLSDAILWRWLNPVVPAQSPVLESLIGHLLFGTCLGSIERPADRPPAMPLESDDAMIDEVK